MDHSPVVEERGDHELQKVLAGKKIQWWRGHYLRMNLICCLLIITSMTNGYVSGCDWLAWSLRELVLTLVCRPTHL
jgi:hypothetical protein